MTSFHNLYSRASNALADLTEAFWDAQERLEGAEFFETKGSRDNPPRLEGNFANGDVRALGKQGGQWIGHAG